MTDSKGMRVCDLLHFLKDFDPELEVTFWPEEFECSQKPYKISEILYDKINNFIHLRGVHEEYLDLVRDKYLNELYQEWQSDLEKVRKND